MCGKRVCSMNDLAAYAALTKDVQPVARRTEPATTNASEKPQFFTQDSLSSTGDESATSLPVVTLDDDDEWGFYDEDD